MLGDQNEEFCVDIEFLKGYRGWTVLTFKSISKIKTPLTIPLLSYAELNFLSSKILLTDQIPHCTAFHLQYTWHESEETEGCLCLLLVQISLKTSPYYCRGI